MTMTMMMIIKRTGALCTMKFSVDMTNCIFSIKKVPQLLLGAWSCSMSCSYFNEQIVSCLAFGAFKESTVSYLGRRWYMCSMFHWDWNCWEHCNDFTFGLSPIDTGMPDCPLMLRDCFFDFAIEHWFGCCSTEPGFARDIGAIEIWIVLKSHQNVVSGLPSNAFAFVQVIENLYISNHLEQTAF